MTQYYHLFFPRYGLKTLLATVTLFSVAMGIVGIRFQQAREQRQAVDAIYAAGGNVIYDYQHDCSNPLPATRSPEWLRNLFGKDLFHNVAVVELRDIRITSKAVLPLKEIEDYWNLDLGGSTIDEKAWSAILQQKKVRELRLTGKSISSQRLKDIRLLSKIERLHLQDVLISEDAAYAIGSLPHLRELTMYDVGISNSALQCFKSLEGLERLVIDLDLMRSSVSDKGFIFLSKLHALEELDLSGVPFTDAALVHIENMGCLSELNLSSSQISDAAFDHLMRIMSPRNEAILSGNDNHGGRTLIHPYGRLNRLNLRYTPLSLGILERLRDSLTQIEIVHGSLENQQ